MSKNQQKISKIMFKPVLGFTLIEVLVVIFIIGILAAVVIVSLSNSRERSRDAKRLSDLNNLQKAINIYFDNQEPGQYPEATNWGGCPTCLNRLLINSLSILPVPPVNLASDVYFYAYNNDVPGYYLGAISLEDDENSALSNTGEYDLLIDSAFTVVGGTGAGTNWVPPDPVNCADPAYCFYFGN